MAGSGRRAPACPPPARAPRRGPASSCGRAPAGTPSRRSAPRRRGWPPTPPPGRWPRPGDVRRLGGCWRRAGRRVVEVRGGGRVALALGTLLAAAGRGRRARRRRGRGAARPTWRPGPPGWPRSASTSPTRWRWGQPASGPPPGRRRPCRPPDVVVLVGRGRRRQRGRRAAARRARCRTCPSSCASGGLVVGPLVLPGAGPVPALPRPAPGRPRPGLAAAARPAPRAGGRRPAARDRVVAAAARRSRRCRCWRTSTPVRRRPPTAPPSRSGCPRGWSPAGPWPAHPACGCA